MEKITIQNRKGQKIVVLLEKYANPRGLAFVMHGLSGNKEQPQIRTVVEAFKEKGYTVVTFDTTNTFGESDGKYEDATVTSYYNDLEDVIIWSKLQPWYTQPYYLVGHSMGGFAVTLYTEKHPSEVKGLAPISTVVSGELSINFPDRKIVFDEWRRTGWRVEMSESTPGRIKKLPWSHMIDRLRYDVLPEAHKIVMPTLLIVGDKDDSTPYIHQLALYKEVKGPKEIHIINGAQHTFTDPTHLAEIKHIFLNWIE
jgi:uncharacterized protein